MRRRLRRRSNPVHSWDREEAIVRIKAALKQRSGIAWSVTGGTGTSWGWIHIDATPKRRTWRFHLRPGAVYDRPEDYEGYDSDKPGGYITPHDAKALARLLGIESVHMQGVGIPASSAYRQEYVDRAEGRKPSVVGEPYWD